MTGPEASADPLNEHYALQEEGEMTRFAEERPFRAAPGTEVPRQTRGGSRLLAGLLWGASGALVVALLWWLS